MVADADVAVDAVELVGGDVDLVAALELEEEILALAAVGGAALDKALVLGDAVLDVHDEVTGLELGEEGFAGDASPSDDAARLGPAENLRVGEEEDAKSSVGPAFAELPVDDGESAFVGCV